MNLHVYPDAAKASEACAEHILQMSFRTIAVSGGSTPKSMFPVLAKSQHDWSKVHLFFVDERAVPPEDPQSNYGLALQYFIGPAHFPEANVHRVRAELPPEEAARLYGQELRGFFGLKAGELPRFDIVHRGVGPDAHTASLFPGEPLIDDHQDLVAAVYVEKFKQWRITLLPGVLLAAGHTVVLAAGEDKAEAVRAIFKEPYEPERYPAQLKADAWFLDEAAARLIN